MQSPRRYVRSSCCHGTTDPLHSAFEHFGEIDNYSEKCIILKMTQQESGNLTRPITIK